MTSVDTNPPAQGEVSRKTDIQKSIYWRY
jgi:hypothetical protein